VRDTGVGYLTFDSISELETIQKIYPQAKLLLRVATTVAATAAVPFVGNVSTRRVSVCQRYGVEANHLKEILCFAKKVNAKVEGISCHFDSLSHDCDSFAQTLSQVYQFYVTASECLGRSDLMVDLDTEIVDWSYDLASNSDSGVVASVKLLKSMFPAEVQFTARPSKYLVMSSHTLGVNVIARRTVTTKASPVSTSDRSENDEFLYYINDGLYGSFNCLVYEKHSVSPQPLREELENEKRYRCTIFGPTCDGIDVVSDHEMLPKLEVGEWLYFENMGAFTVSSSTSFNGFDLPKFHYFFCG